MMVLATRSGRRRGDATGARGRAGAAVVLLLVLSLAGCFGSTGPGPQESPPEPPSPPTRPSDFAAIRANLSQPDFPGEPVFEEHWVESFDGTELRVRVYRPDAPAAWRAPIILQMSPYFGLESVAADGLSGWLIDHFVPRGYAVALSDVRGSGESGGCLEHTGRNEARDGYEVVEYLAALPWSNARVGMIGLSYDAETQQATLTTAPPHLTTIVPVASIASLYDHVYFDAVPYETVGAVGAASYAVQGMLPPSPPVNPVGRPNPHSPGVYTERPGCHADNVRHRSDPSGDYNDYWAARDLRVRIPDVRNTSVFYVHGLQDWNVKPIHVDGWYDRLPVPKKAWLGHWGHVFPDEVGRADWRFAVHRWFDHWLRDIDTGVMDEPAVQVQDSEGQWRTEDAWPPQRGTEATWFLAPDGRLTPAAPAHENEVTYADSGLSMESQRGASVAWTTDTFGEDFRYAGTPGLTMQAVLSSQVPGGPDAPGTHFVAHLVDVAPDGSETIINRGYLDAQHRETLNESRPVPNGEVITYEVRFYPQDDVVPAGHALRLRVGAVDDWVQPDGTNAQVTVVVGGDPASSIMLPSLKAEPARFFSPGSP